MTDLEKLEQYRGNDGFLHLKRSYSELYKKTLYTTSEFMIQDRVIEYDIKSAGLSMMKASGRFSKEVLDRLESMPKEQRNIEIGNMRKINPKITKIIDDGIKEARRMFFQANDIQDDMVVSIKKDAVFIRGAKLKALDFCEVHFVAKNTYSLFMMIEKIEFYYDRRHDRVDIKGISDDIYHGDDHQNGIMKFFSQVFGYINQDRWDDLRKYLIQFAEDYKTKKLPIVYYRELNGYDVYRTMIELTGYGYNIQIASEEDKDMINGVYNYKKFILPLIQQFL